MEVEKYKLNIEGGYRAKVKIMYDEYPLNPYKDYDQLSDLTSWVRNYDLDSKDAIKFDSPDEVKKALKRGELVFAAPVFAYIHSGITVKMGSMGNWPDQQWDCGLAGYVYVTREKAKSHGGYKRITKKVREEVAKIAEAEIKEFDMYLTGQSYYATIKVKDLAGKVVHKGIESGLWDLAEMRKYIEDSLNYMAKNGTFSDGEQMCLPIL